MLDVTLAGWAATIGLIAVLFVVDLFVSRPGHAHAIGLREAYLSSKLPRTLLGSVCMNGAVKI